MFQPQPTPFTTSSSFASYGLAQDLDFAFPVSAGGGSTAVPTTTTTTTAGYYNSPALSHTQSHLLQSQSQSQSQHQHQHQHQPHLVHQQQQLPPRQRQISASSAAPSSASPYSNGASNSISPVISQASNSNSNPSSSSPSLAQQPQDRQRLLQHPHQHQQPQYQPQVVLKMEDQGQHDMAAQQAAARDYQPVLEGLKVGNKILSDAITNEYAKADPVYVEKTIALPQTYSHYRPIQGDGNCGWRAIGFSYFEKLIESGDQAKIEGEVARLMSVNPLLSTVGNYPYWEDMADEVLDHLREVAQNIGNPQYAHQLNQNKWNEPGSADSMIYYLRLLAATYLKTNPTRFADFVPDGSGVAAYCANQIDIPNRDIEELGLIALAEILLQPANFVLEVVMLDRSPGAQANTYRWPQEDIGPIINLLYRPGHYDILYKGMATQVLRVSGFTHNTNITSEQADLGQYTTMNFDALSIIPGFSSSAGMGGLAQFAPPPPVSASETFSPVQQSPWMSSFPEPLPTPTPRAAPPPPPPIMATPQPPTPPASISGGSAMAPSPAMSGPQNTLPLRTAASSYHIRFSPVQLDYDEGKNNFPDSTFQVTTNTFKNSIWNRAHYCNPNFHPEEWNPDDEHTDGRVGSKRRMKKEMS